MGLQDLGQLAWLLLITHYDSHTKLPTAFLKEVPDLAEGSKEGELSSDNCRAVIWKKDYTYSA